MAVRRDLLTVFLYGLVGGSGDATSFLRYDTFTGHVTGNLVLLAISVSRFAWSNAARRMFAICVFLAVTRLGFAIAAFSRRAIWLFGLQASLLCLLYFAEWRHGPMPLLGIGIFCAMLGLQNGMVTAVHGVSFHSTFLSGDFTTLLKPRNQRPASLPASSGGVIVETTSPFLPVLVTGFLFGAVLAALSIRFQPALSLPFFLLTIALAFVSTPPTDEDSPHASTFRAAV